MNSIFVLVFVVLAVVFCGCSASFKYSGGSEPDLPQNYQECFRFINAVTAEPEAGVLTRFKLIRPLWFDRVSLGKSNDKGDVLVTIPLPCSYRFEAGKINFFPAQACPLWKEKHYDQREHQNISVYCIVPVDAPEEVKKQHDHSAPAANSTEEWQEYQQWSNEFFTSQNHPKRQMTPR